MGSTTEGTSTSAAVRQPTRADGARMWSFVHRFGGLDANSPYAYVKLAEDFGAHSAVVDGPDGGLAGFVLGYRPPDRPAPTLFVWQVGVSPSARGQGLARRMISEIIARDDATTYVEATVTPDNAASRALFRSIARDHGTECAVVPHLAADDFPEDAPPHEPEDLFVIGPLR